MARVVDVVYDTTSAANGALDTGALDVSNGTSVIALAVAGAGTTQIAPFLVDEGGTARAIATAATASAAQINHWAPGSTLPTGGVGGLALSLPVPRKVKFTTTAAGVGNTVRLTVWRITEV